MFNFYEEDTSSRFYRKVGSGDCMPASNDGGEQELPFGKNFMVYQYDGNVGFYTPPQMGRFVRGWDQDEDPSWVFKPNSWDWLSFGFHDHVRGRWLETMGYESK